MEMLLSTYPYRSRVRRIYSDLQEIALGDGGDCIFSVAILEHLSFYTTAIACQPRLDGCRGFNESRSAVDVFTHE